MNGSGYLFAVLPTGQYAPVPAAGTVDVRGLDQTVSVQYSIPVIPQFPLWFNETGLPSSTLWSVTVVGTGSFQGSVSNSSLTSSIGFVVPQGLTGTYTVSEPSGFVAVPVGGDVVVPTPGVPVTVDIVYSASGGGGGPPPAPTITSFFALPVSLTLGASVTFHVVVANGALPLAYSYGALPAGCSSANVTSLPCTPSSAAESSVIVTVTDTLGRTARASASILVSAPPGPTGRQSNSTGPTTFLGLPQYEGYGVVLLGALVAVAVAAIVLRSRARDLPPPSAPESDA
ncbi:MAG: hypothetical protein L3K06_04075 [Thermoplasmata archaeon]|nr:hypothetical protein [Thermoplasmata archaeon]